MENKKCEKCGTDIPLHYNNLLCDVHYQELVKVNEKATAPAQPLVVDESYHENEEVEELDLVSRCHGRFKGTGQVMPVAQRQIYEAIKKDLVAMTTSDPQFPKFLWKPKVADVGCGIGIGSNILSQEADFVWGIDKSDENIRFAKQMFARQKNNLYYSAQVMFDVIDVTNEPRELAQFDAVACVEVIEHFKNPELLMKFLKRLNKKKGSPTVYYISTPNRNAWAGTDRANKPLNPHHVREFTVGEYRALLSQYFVNVVIDDPEMKSVLLDSDVITPVVAKCSVFK